MSSCGADRIGIVGFSAGGHLAGLAALGPGSDEHETVDFVVTGYAITSMETETYRPSRIVLLGEHATPQLRRETSLDALVTPSAPPFFIWHTAEDVYVPPEHAYRLARALAANDVAHTVHVFAHGPHSLGLARGAAMRRSGRRWRRRGSPSGSPLSSRSPCDHPRPSLLPSRLDSLPASGRTGRRKRSAVASACSARATPPTT